MTHAERFYKWMEENPESVKTIMEKAQKRFGMTENDFRQKVRGAIWWLETNQDTGKANKKKWDRFLMNWIRPKERSANVRTTVSKFSGSTDGYKVR